MFNSKRLAADCVVTGGAMVLHVMVKGERWFEDVSEGERVTERCSS